MLLSLSKHLTIRLTEGQRAHLQGVIRAGSAPARTQTRALLHNDRS